MLFVTCGGTKGVVQTSNRANWQCICKSLSCIKCVYALSIFYTTVSAVTTMVVHRFLSTKNGNCCFKYSYVFQQMSHVAVAICTTPELGANRSCRRAAIPVSSLFRLG